ncbi:MAG: hypothetical protein ACUVTM_00830 [Candidatus Bathyarchaeia archaeon]
MEAQHLASVKPPIPVKVRDMRNFARLVLALSEGSQIVLGLPYKNKYALCFFTAYMYWEGCLPILAYLVDEEPGKPFLAYRSDGPYGEEYFYTGDVDDARYRYASVVSVKDTPNLFKDSLEGNYPKLPKPLMVEVENIASIVRVLIPLSVREGTVFPLWHFESDGEHNIGVVTPFEHYYEADALPIFFYLRMKEPPPGPFIRYSATKPSGERLEFTSNTSDVKYFYVKIIDIEEPPFFP